MRLPRPDRGQKRHAAAHRCRAHRHQLSPHRRCQIKPPQEAPDRQYRQAARHQRQDRRQPRAQLAQHDLTIGQVGDKRMEQCPSRLVHAHRARRRRWRSQDHHGKLDADQRAKEHAGNCGRLRRTVECQVRWPPRQRQTSKQQSNVQGAQRVNLPSPRRDQALECEYRTWAPAHPHRENSPSR